MLCNVTVLYRLENELKFWISCLVTAMGFILGLVLTGVGGLSAQTIDFLNSKSENNKKIDKYWSETGLGYQDLAQLISDDKCYNSQIYFDACLNAILENSLRFNLKISFADGQLIPINKTDNYDEKTEKELLRLYSGIIHNIHFKQITEQLVSRESIAGRAMLISQLINSFLSVYYDPHTYILPTNFYDEVGSKIERNKYFVGIAYEKFRGEFYIRKISKNSDAEISGLKINDKILALNAGALAGVSYSGISKLLKNEDTENLNFLIQRENKILSIDIKRTFRKLSHVQFNLLPGDNYFGLITLSKFNRGVCAGVAARLTEANKNKMTGLVLDLRDNPGGQLNEAACIAGLFLGKNKKAYYVEYFDQAKPNEVVLTSEERLYNGPLIVLVNSASASAAELLAGGLQEYKRALVIGEPTFGKGTFQESEEWLMNPKVSLFKTQGLYLLPSRNSTQLEGIRPDIILHAEATPVKGENSTFFNPVKAGSHKYSQLRKSEWDSKYIYEKCKTRSLQISDDLYIQESIKYLECARPAEKLADSDTGKSTTNRF